MRRRIGVLVCVGMLLPVFLSAQEEGGKQEYWHAAMGVKFRLVIYCRDAAKASRVFQAASDRIDELDRCLSDYLTNSENTRLSQSSPHLTFQTVSADLYRILERAQALSEATSGAFDCTVGPASHLWRAAIKRNRLPTAEQIKACLPRMGFRRLELRAPNEVRLSASEMQLDFGAIAQGYAADEILKIYQAEGIAAGLVDASGDLAVRGAPPGQNGWRIAIEQEPDQPPLELSLSDGAVSTSGDRYQSLVIDGLRYSHLVDPRTGWAVRGRRQATVIAPDATTADALASACCILSPDEVGKLAETFPDVFVHLAWDSETPQESDRRHTQSTPGFEDFLISR